MIRLSILPRIWGSGVYTQGFDSGSCQWIGKLSLHRIHRLLGLRVWTFCCIWRFACPIILESHRLLNRASLLGLPSSEFRLQVFVLGQVLVFALFSHVDAFLAQSTGWCASASPLSQLVGYAQPRKVRGPLGNKHDSNFNMPCISAHGSLMVPHLRKLGHIVRQQYNLRASPKLPTLLPTPDAHWRRFAVLDPQDALRSKEHLHILQQSFADTATCTTTYKYLCEFRVPHLLHFKHQPWW